jgi:hypothetical protein
MTTFYSLRFATPLTLRTRSPYLYPPGTAWRCSTPRHWVHSCPPPWLDHSLCTWRRVQVMKHSDFISIFYRNTQRCIPEDSHRCDTASAVICKSIWRAGMETELFSLTRNLALWKSWPFRLKIWVGLLVLFWVISSWSRFRTIVRAVSPSICLSMPETFCTTVHFNQWSISNTILEQYFYLHIKSFL